MFGEPGAEAFAVAFRKVARVGPGLDDLWLNRRAAVMDAELHRRSARLHREVPEPGRAVGDAEAFHGELFARRPDAHFHFRNAVAADEAGERDLHRADRVAGGAERADLREIAELFIAANERRENGPEGTRIDRAVPVAAHLAVAGAGIHAGAAADALKTARRECPNGRYR